MRLRRHLCRQRPAGRAVLRQAGKTGGRSRFQQCMQKTARRRTARETVQPCAPHLRRILTVPRYHGRVRKRRSTGGPWQTGIGGKVVGCKHHGVARTTGRRQAESRIVVASNQPAAGLALADAITVDRVGQFVRSVGSFNMAGQRRKAAHGPAGLRARPRRARRPVGNRLRRGAKWRGIGRRKRNRHHPLRVAHTGRQCLGSLCQCVRLGLAMRLQSAPHAAVGATVKHRQPHPGRMPGTGQRDIGKAHRFEQQLVIGPRQRPRILLEAPHRPCIIALIPIWLSGRFLRHIGRKRQKHQRILQPLRLVHGDNLEQRLVALQPHLRGIVASVLIARKAAPVATQQATDAATGLTQPLQVLAQLQQIGKAALSGGCVRAGQQTPDDTELVQQPAQHRQHPLSQPDLATGTKPRARLAQRRVGHRRVSIIGRCQRGKRRTQQGRCQGRQHRAATLRIGAGRQPHLQLHGLVTAIDGTPLRQIHAANLPRRQRPAHGVCLLAGAHQYRAIGCHQRPQAAIRMAEPRLAQRTKVEQACDFGGARRCRLRRDQILGWEPGLALAGSRNFAIGKAPCPEAERGGGGPIDFPHLGPSLRRHRPEWHRVAIRVARVAITEGSTRHCRLCRRKHRIDGADHRRAGTEVRTQRRHPPVAG